MENAQLKILLQLLGKNNYGGKIAEVKPTSKTTISQTRNLCQKLKQKQYIEVKEKIEAIAITKKGKAYIPQAKVNEKKILEKCLRSTCLVGKIKFKTALLKQEIIEDLLSKDLIKISRSKITEVYLTPQGQQYLLTECNLLGKGNITLYKPLFNNYLQFLCQNLLTSGELTPTTTQVNDDRDEKQNQSISIVKPKQKPNDGDVLQTIIDLDKQNNTDNYLPIFHLRRYYEEVMTREELDQILYNLQRENKLSLSRLIDGSKYSREEYQAGIPQKVGGVIFYLSYL